MKDIRMHDPSPIPVWGTVSPRLFRWGAVFGLAVSAAGGVQGAGAAPVTSSAITVEQPWSRATPGGATVAIGCLTIRNGADAPDRLVSATTEVAGRAGAHSMTSVNGVMEMRALPDGIPIPPHGTVVLTPGGDHLMLEALSHPLKKGDRFSGTLVFERAGPVPVTFSVESIGAKGPGKPSAPDAMPMKMN